MRSISASRRSIAVADFAPFARLTMAASTGVRGAGVIGTYLHGAFEHPDVCAEVFGIDAPSAMSKAAQYQRLAAWFEQHARHSIGSVWTRHRFGRHTCIGNFFCSSRRSIFGDPAASWSPTSMEPHQVLSTSVRHGGQVDHVRHLLNHQSCEGTAHHERHRVMTEDGLDAYHDRVCAEVALPAGRRRPSWELRRT